MNICSTAAANLEGDSEGAGGKSFYGGLEGEGTCSALASEGSPDVRPFHGVLSLLNFLLPRCS